LEWAIGNGQWAISNKQWTIDNRQSAPAKATADKRARGGSKPIN
jgi:hypothetical protein